MPKAKISPDIRKGAEALATLAAEGTTLCNLWPTLGLWEVEKADGRRYIIDPGEGTCTCPAGKHNHTCKHLRAVWLLEKVLG